MIRFKYLLVAKLMGITCQHESEIIFSLTHVNLCFRPGEIKAVDMNLV